MNFNLDFFPDELWQIILATLLGGLIGAEREYHNKSAGFRTVILITLGSAIITMLSIRIGVHDNRDRIAANIVQGIGFLGAGAIFRDDNTVRGLTTAATIWVAAAIGMCVGSGNYLLAVCGTLLILIILLAVVGVERRIDKSNRVRRYKLVSDYTQETLLDYEKLFESFGLKHERGLQSKLGDKMIGNWIISGPQDKHEKLVDTLLADSALKEFDF